MTIYFIERIGGEKLERWGDYLLVRPDPQVIWNTKKENEGWKHPNGHYHRSKKGGGEWEFFSLPKQWQIHYRDLIFHLKPFSFKHTGLFPEQATNWDWFSAKIHSSNRPVKVLNLFAYTGGATLAAAKAGAQVTHVDASKGMVSWAKENAAASGPETHRQKRSRGSSWFESSSFRRTDTLACGRLYEICGREIRRGNRYDAVIMDLRPTAWSEGRNLED